MLDSKADLVRCRQGGHYAPASARPSGTPGKGTKHGGDQPRRRPARRCLPQPTVSRALRDSPRVPRGDQGAGPQAARALGYVPSETGRALSSGRTRRIGLLLTDLENQFYPHVIAPMHRELEALGLPAGAAHRDHRHRPRWPNGWSPTASTACCWPPRPWTRSCPSDCATAACPFVYFNRTRHAVEADSADRRSECRALPSWPSEIAALGHRRVGAIFGPRNTSTARQRETALRDALGRARPHHRRELHAPRPVRLRHRLRGHAQLLASRPAARR